MSVPTSVPAIPQNFLVQQGNGTVYLSWNLVAGATSYVVERSVDGVSFILLSSPSTNSYLDQIVSVGSQYFYQVASVNLVGQSGFTPNQGIVPTQPGEATLGQIRLQAQQRADRVNSQFVTTTEWNTYINQSYFELYDLLVTVYEDYYLAPGILIKTDGVTVQYPLPDGILSFYEYIPGNPTPTLFTPRPFYKLWGVDCGLDASSNSWVTLRKFDAIQRNRYVYPQMTATFFGVFNLRYRLVGNTLWFIPSPSANQFIRVWYIPRVATLLMDTDILDGISGWSEYVITDAAIKALQKEESDVSILAQQKMMLRSRIEESAMNRDVGQPDTISDTRSFQNLNGFYGNGNFDGSYGGY